MQLYVTRAVVKREDGKKETLSFKNLLNSDYTKIHSTDLFSMLAISYQQDNL